ncbi:hypothetical protein KAJ27_10995 [bacterium]|nr:hypothetical protein [bacterium]
MRKFDVRGMAIPVVVTIIVVIIILVFAMSKTGTNYYRFAVSEIKALKIERFLDAFLQETTAHLRTMMNSTSDDSLKNIKKEFLNLPANGSSPSSTIKPLIFKAEFIALYSKTLKDLAKELELNFSSFIADNVEAEIISSEALPVPKYMKPDSKEKKSVLKITAFAKHKGVERQKWIKFRLKIIRITLPVISKFTLFVKDSLNEPNQFSSTIKGLGYNFAYGHSGKVYATSGNSGLNRALILDNDPNDNLALDKRGMIYLGDGSGHNNVSDRTMIRLVDEEDYFDAEEGKCPQANIWEVTINNALYDDHLTGGRRGYKKLSEAGSVFVYALGFSDYLSRNDILTQYSLKNFLKPSEFNSLKLECFQPDLEFNTMNRCAPMLLFGSMTNKSPTVVYGNAYRTYLRLTDYDRHNTICMYQKKTGNQPRDFLVVESTNQTGNSSTWFSASTKLLFDDYIPTVVVQPYSGDKTLNKADTYSDSDTDSGFDLFYYNYSDFQKTSQRSSADETEYKKGLDKRVCMEYFTQDDFKNSCLVGNELHVRYGVIKVRGDLDLTSNSYTSLKNVYRCIIIVTGKLTLPSIFKKTDEATVTFIAALNDNISDSGKIVASGTNINASLMTWRNDSTNIQFNSSTGIRGSLILQKIFLKEKLTSSSISLKYDPALSGDPTTGEKDYFFSFLPNWEGVW